MSDDLIQIHGGKKLQRVGAELRILGDRELKRDITASIRVTAKPLVPAIRANARAVLPKRGGLNERVAKSRISTSVRFGARTSGVSIRISHPSDNLKRMDEKGEVRHPVFGRWLPNQPAQQVTAHWASEPFEKHLPVVREGAVKAIEAAARRVR